jgi:hypothetical protein
MPRRKPDRDKKYFTAEQANRALPLVRAIVSDVAALAAELRGLQERLAKSQQPRRKDGLEGAYAEEWQHAQHQLQQGAARMEEYLDELRELGVELKGWDGLVDFPCWMDDREVYLCWKLGEPEVAHWHEIDAGFAGRQKLLATAAAPDSPDFETLKG